MIYVLGHCGQALHEHQSLGALQQLRLVQCQRALHVTRLQHAGAQARRDIRQQRSDRVQEYAVGGCVGQVADNSVEQHVARGLQVTAGQARVIAVHAEAGLAGFMQGAQRAGQSVIQLLFGLRAAARVKAGLANECTGGGLHHALLQRK